LHHHPVPLEINCRKKSIKSSSPIAIVCIFTHLPRTVIANVDIYVSETMAEENPLTASSRAFFSHRHMQLLMKVFPPLPGFKCLDGPQDDFFPFNASVAEEKPEKSEHTSAFVRGLSNGNNSIIHTAAASKAGLDPLIWL
jgi:hypothetical protein